MTLAGILMEKMQQARVAMRIETAIVILGYFYKLVIIISWALHYASTLYVS